MNQMVFRNAKNTTDNKFFTQNINMKKLDTGEKLYRTLINLKFRPMQEYKPYKYIEMNKHLKQLMQSMYKNVTRPSATKANQKR